jgi:hypothetical protein
MTSLGVAGRIFRGNKYLGVLNRPLNLLKYIKTTFKQETSVADVDPPDPHVFGPPGSRSTSQDRALDPDPSIIIQKK